MSVLRPRALKVRRDEFNCPVAVFEPPDPTKIPMYPKHQVQFFLEGVVSVIIR